MKKEFFPGWLLMAALGVLSMLLSKLVVAGGKHPLEATALAVIIGLLARNLGLVPAFFHAGIRQFEKPLIWGVILIGATLNFRDIGSQGPRMLAIILVTMTVSYLVIYALGRMFKLSPTLSTLLSVGTTICGGSAIAITAPLIKAKEEETAMPSDDHALGLAAILFIPRSPRRSGLATSLSEFSPAQRSTPHRKSCAGSSFRPGRKTATAVKLVRNCFMAPWPLIAAWFTRTHPLAAAKEKKGQSARAFPCSCSAILSWPV
jgi:uncharacterized membrane protein YadS